LSQRLIDEVTIVTAYFNIGDFGKGAQNNIRTSKTYRDWMNAFSRLESRVIAYFDTDEMVELFTRIRSNLPTNLTIVRKINRTMVGLQMFVILNIIHQSALISNQSFYLAL
jgi:hypothetical protein